MRMAGSPKEYSCASEGEENSALYNMACCWAALGQKQVGSGSRTSPRCAAPSEDGRCGATPHNVIAGNNLAPRESQCASLALSLLQSALTVLEALLDNNFEDYAAIRSDPDLAALRGPELEALLSK